MATIHINPKNKGKFNATKARTGKSTEELTHSKNPLTRKRAIFAQNARKWKHEFGGELNDESLLGNDIQNYPDEYIFDSFLNQADQYGFGSWLKKNAGILGTAVGAGVGTVIAPGIGTQIGAQLGGTVGGSIQAGYDQSSQEELEQKQVLTDIAKARTDFASGGGLSRSEDYGSEKKPYPSVKSGDFAGGHRSYPIPTRADAVDALRLAGLHGRADVKAKVYAKYPDLKKEDGGSIDLWFGKPDYDKEEHLMDKYAHGGPTELSANWVIPVPTYSSGGNFDFMMAFGGKPIQPNVEDVDGSNMKHPTVNDNIYTKGSSLFTKRRGGVEVPKGDFTNYNSGQTHEQSRIGGIPVGKNALTETGEVRYDSKKYGSYIFSNRF